MAKAKLIPVLICTEYRGVFMGWAKEVTVADQEFFRVRNCIYWSSDVGGVLGLATNGPTSGCKIGALVEGPQRLSKITYCSRVSDDAVKAWEAAPCHGRK